MIKNDVMILGKSMLFSADLHNARSANRVVNGRAIAQPGVAPLAANSDVAPAPRADLGVSHDIMIATPTGRRHIADLQIGDVVFGDAGRATTITSITKSSSSARRALKLRAPYFGLDQDMIVGYDQPLTIQSDAAEYLFGTAMVSAPAHCFKDGVRVVHHELGPRDRICAIQLADATTINVGGCLVGTDTKFGKPTAKALTHAEAKCFAAEYGSGYCN